jgi:transcriptional regulator with PAS, ATPase and Fis domain
MERRDNSIVGVNSVDCLQEIQSMVQKTAEAIADVLKIDVEIADSKLVRVAGTGIYKGQCGQVMTDGFVYQHVLHTGSTVLIENPGHHVLCQPCPQRQNCFEIAEMASPILLQGRPVGVIGLICFSSEQAKRLLDCKEWMLQFIVKMAELIAGNLPQDIGGNEPTSSQLRLDCLEKETIAKAMAEVSGSVGRKERVAELLGISRATLYRKLKEYQIR